MALPAEATLPKDSWRFFLRPRDAWEAMYEDCARARESIEFEQYILHNDVVGRKFLALFTEKARQKVKVFVLCDMFGSSSFYRTKQVRQLRAAGGAFYFYRPYSWLAVLMPWQWFPRTHTKTLLIDSKVAYTGGVCLNADMREWRDTQVRFTGSAVAEVRAAFDALEPLRGRRRRCFPFHFPDLTDREFVYLQNIPKSRHAIYAEMISAINRAQMSVYISTAYFAPTRRFIRSLAQTRARGVNVCLMIGRTSDIPLAGCLCLTYLPSLLKAGVRVFHYKNTILHCKTMVVDDSWATVGSTNMDVISFFHNREANLIILEREAVAELKGHFKRDLEYSVEITRREWSRIPLWQKALGWLMRGVKIFF